MSENTRMQYCCIRAHYVYKHFANLTSTHTDNTYREHTQRTHTENTHREHTQRTHTKNTHREHTQRAHTENTHRERTQNATHKTQHTIHETPRLRYKSSHINISLRFYCTLPSYPGSLWQVMAAPCKNLYILSYNY